MVVVAAAAGVYSIYGGLAATTCAAMLQLLVVLAGGVLLVALGSRGPGGVEGVVKKNLAADPGRLGLLLPAASEICPGSACSCIALRSRWAMSPARS